MYHTKDVFFITILYESEFGSELLDIAQSLTPDFQNIDAICITLNPAKV